MYILFSECKITMTPYFRQSLFIRILFRKKTNKIEKHLADKEIIRNFAPLFLNIQI